MSENKKRKLTNQTGIDLLALSIVEQVKPPNSKVVIAVENGFAKVVECPEHVEVIIDDRDIASSVLAKYSNYRIGQIASLKRYQLDIAHPWRW